MNPAEFQALRLSLGLSNPQLAELLGVLPRTTQRWATGERDPPQRLMNMLADMGSMANKFAQESLEAAQKGDSKSEIVLTAYRSDAGFRDAEPRFWEPASVYLMMLWRTKIALEAAGFRATIQYAD